MSANRAEPEFRMSRYAFVLFAPLAVSALVGARSEDPVPAPKDDKGAKRPLAVKVSRDVLFDTIDDTRLYLDVAVPEGDGPFPCVVMFHGGAWSMGSRKDLSNVIEMVAARGFVAVSASYRLAPKHKFPAQIQDARSAVRFLRAKSKDYKIDSDCIGTCGFSAGGHLALLLGLAGKVEGWDAGANLETSCKVKCVVDFFGPADLALYGKTPGLEDAYMVPVFGKQCKTDPDIYKQASPVTYVTKDAPPVLILHGTFDLVVPIVHSEALHKKLRDAGASAELIPVRGAGHGWEGKTLTRTTEDALKFFETHLKDKK
jgi:acetyl esterase/lipase